MGYRLLSKYRGELMGAAMLWVMLFHAADLDMCSGALELIRAAGFGGVDIFIALSAMGMVMSLERREQTYGEFLARRMRRILPAYFAVMLPYTAFVILYRGAPWAALLWNSTLLYYWVDCEGAFNWYVAGIMCLYAITPPCRRFLKRCRHRECAVILGVVLGVLLCQLLLREGYWHYLDLFYRLPVFFLGLLMGFYAREEKTLGRREAALWTLLLLAGVCYGVLVLRSQREGGGLYTPLCHVFLLTTIPLCLTACVLFEKLPLGVLRRALRFVGGRSLEIYLLNVSVFSELALWERILPFDTANRLSYLVLFALNILLGALLHCVLAAALTGKNKMLSQ